MTALLMEWSGAAFMKVRRRLVEEASEPGRKGRSDQKSNFGDRRRGEFLERDERSLENFWLVALLPLRLVTSNI
jgi:hypothetical protein